MFTSLTRWLAFGVMIGLTVSRLASPTESHGHPPLAVLQGLPALLGACVYSFMCHHSLPGMLSPMSDKAGLFRYLALDYLLILLFYLALALPAIFAFPHLEDLYTLNFAPGHPLDGGAGTIFREVVDYFLILFPVFTLTASFPIIAVTLRSNFQAMFSRYESWVLHKICLPTLVIMPPILVALTTENIEILVGITGSYAGVGIQYVIPASLVLLARASVPAPIARLPNRHLSPFRSSFWPYLVILWASVCLVTVTFNIAQNYFA
ncbi:hypothetical protein AAG570_002193 [Ranatra chinensis]|uniref:Amino acid transporter transmembrane domain-containing protein n=1 Tax=Ranatra chinensis TaxID=642074 RepID=A0ABD0Y6U6_9HEMI